MKNKKKKKQQAVTVKTTKTTYTTKKITNIKKKKAYVKIRAYRIVNGKYVYGKWSGSQDCKGEEINWLSVNNDKGTAHAKAKALVWAVLPREASF